VNHLRARRLLSALPDGTLPPATEAELRTHAAACQRCQRILADYEAMDRFLRSFPERLVPPIASNEAEGALRLLARWAGPLRAPWFERVPIHPLGAVVTAAALLLGVFLLTPPFQIESAEPFNVVVMASARTVRVERPRRAQLLAQPTIREHPSESYLLPVAVR
jgi:anti-sigma factor RsiW